MSASIKKFELLGEYRIRLTFDDGAVGNVDLHKLIVGRGGVFAPLENPAYFRQVRINPDFETLEWPSGVDFCPDVLYSEATGKPLPFGNNANEPTTPHRKSA